MLAFQLTVLVATALCASAQLSTCLTQTHFDHKSTEVLSLKSWYKRSHFQNEISSEVSHCDCKQMHGLLTSAVDFYDVYYGEKLRKMCQCNSFNWSGISDRIEIELLNANNLVALVGAVAAANELGHTLSNDTKSLVLHKIRGLMLPDATFRNTVEADGNIENIHEVLHLLDIFSDFPPAQEFFGEIQDKLLDLIPSGDGTHLSDPTLLAALSALSSKKLRLSAPRLLVVAESLLSLVAGSEIDVALKALKSLKVVSTYKSAPLHVSFVKSAFARDSVRRVQLQVLDVLGSPVVIQAAELLSLKIFGKDNAVLEGRQFDGHFLDLTADKLAVGKYSLQLAVSVEDRAKPIPFQAVVAFLDAVRLSDVLVGAVEGVHPTRSQLQPGGAAAEFVASVSDAHHVSVEFSVSRQQGQEQDERVRKPHQAFVSFKHAESGESVVFVARRAEDSSDSQLHYSVRFVLADEMAKFSHSSGLYQITVLVADAHYISPISAVVGSVQLKFPPKQTANLPLYSKSLLHTSDHTLQALPEITHLMRPPARQASGFMATLFTSLTALPLVVFVGFLVSLRPNLRRLSSLSSAALAVLLGLTLLLYVGYWLAVEGVSFYQTIKYMCFLFPATVAVGGYALSAVSEARVASLAAKVK